MGDAQTEARTMSSADLCVGLSALKLGHERSRSDVAKSPVRAFVQVWSTVGAVLAFAFTQAMPASLACTLEYSSLVPIGCPFAAANMK